MLQLRRSFIGLLLIWGSLILSYFYVILKGEQYKSPALDDSYLYVSAAELKTRKIAETIARALKCDIISIDGNSVSYDKLGVPYAEKALELTEKVEIPDNSDLKITKKRDEIEIIHSKRLKAPLILGFVLLFSGLGISAVIIILPMVATSSSSKMSGGQFIFSLTLTLILVAPFFYGFFRGVRSYFRKKIITITPEFLFYRNYKIPLRLIKELDGLKKLPIRIITFDRIVKISTFFCAVPEMKYLYTVLHDSIIDMGKKR